MKITVCPDSFKGSLSAERACEVISSACREIASSVFIEQKPMADGGEGTVDALVVATNGQQIEHQVTGPLGTQVESYYGVHGSEKIAYLEVANTAGLTQVPESQRDPFKTTSYGLGEMLKEMLNQKYNKVIIGLGGSATNDGGLGFLQALGVKFLNEEGKEVGMFGEDLAQVKRVDFSGLDQRIRDLDIRVACDVNNLLCGEKGASAVFGPQKGATQEQIMKLDDWLNDFGQIVNPELMNNSGAGAAGGLGFALLSIGAELVSGAELVGQTIKLKEAIKNSNLVITGEGKSDKQTLYGKAPGYAAEIAKASEVPIVLISGSIDDPDQELLDYFSATMSIINQPMSLEKAIENSESLLRRQVKNVLNFYQDIKH